MTDRIEAVLERAGATSLADPDRGALELACASALRRAETGGLVDIAYTTTDSPVGPLLLAATVTGLVRVAYIDDGADPVLVSLSERLSPRLVEMPARLDGARRELDDYFGGSRRDFELSLDWSLVGGFRRSVLEVTAAIPYGRTAAYGEVARAAGAPRAARAAGSALAANPLPIVVPCHRVTRAGGLVGQYTGGAHRKHFLLDLESGSVGP